MTCRKWSARIMACRNRGYCRDNPAAPGQRWLCPKKKKPQIWSVSSESSTENKREAFSVVGFFSCPLVEWEIILMLLILLIRPKLIESHSGQCSSYFYLPFLSLLLPFENLFFFPLTQFISCRFLVDCQLIDQYREDIEWLFIKWKANKTMWTQDILTSSLQLNYGCFSISAFLRPRIDS